MKFPLQDGVFQEKDKLLVLLKKILLVPLLVAGGAAIVYFYLAANAYAGTEVKFLSRFSVILPRWRIFLSTKTLIF
ncbi:MAG: hypothetical protein ACLS4Z_07060 [Christensenellaceae bacterium]